MQAVAGEPADRQVDLRLAHQPPIGDDAQKEPRQHQPDRISRTPASGSIPGRPTPRGVQIAPLLAQPAEVEHPLDTGQHGVVGDELTKRAEPQTKTSSRSRPSRPSLAIPSLAASADGIRNQRPRQRPHRRTLAGAIPWAPAELAHARRRPSARPAPARLQEDRPEIAAGVESRARWRAAYEEVRRRHLAGETLVAIGQDTGLARATVRKYAHAEVFPERAASGPGPSRLDPYVAYIERRTDEGCEDAMALWREVREFGYDGTPRQVQRFVAQRRSAPAARTPRKWLGRVAAWARVDAAPTLPSSKALAGMLVQPATALPEHAAAAVARVEQDAEAARVAGLARRFTALVRCCGIQSGERLPDSCGALNAWIAEARMCGTTASRPSPRGSGTTSPRCAPR